MEKLLKVLFAILILGNLLALDVLVREDNSIVFQFWKHKGDQLKWIG